MQKKKEIWLLKTGLKQHILLVISIIELVITFFIFSIYNYASEQIGFNIDEIVFYMQLPLEGTGGNLLSGYWIKHCLVIVISFCVLIGIIAIHCVWTKHGAYLKLRNLLCLCGFMISTSLLFGGIGGLAISLGVPTYIKQQLALSGFIEDNYKDPQKVEIEFPKKKRNLIWIYMESMESTFISKEEGGAMKENLLPEMTKLATENINFSESSQVGGATASQGTDWTTGALFAQTCGLPMKLPIGHGDVGEYEKFAPGAEAIGDILEKEGYYQKFIMGSDAEFGGRKSYLKKHGAYQLYDYNTAIQNGDIYKNYYVWWGFEDQKLYGFAKRELQKAADQKQPFAVSLLTVDTHFSNGYFCKQCQHKHDSEYQDVLNCASRQLAEFVSWIQKQDFYDNTAIVITGDHPTMDKSFIGEYYDGSKERKVYNCIINAPIKTDYEKNRKFNTFDFYPTVIAALGAKIDGNRLGLGTNLFSGEKTLAEKYGYDKIDKEFAKKSTFYNEYIWEE